jgi:hypothetical protein
VLEDAMYGWTEITGTPDSELCVHDPYATDQDRVTWLELGASPDGDIQWSSTLDEGLSVLPELAPRVDGGRYTGWVLVA